jgi:Uncharacterised nucleotidyltransferase
MRAASFTAPERQLALLLVGTRARRAGNRARIEELVARTDFRELAAFLRQTPMLPLIGRRLLELSDAAPASFVREVARYSGLAQRQGVSQALVTARLIAALTEDGVRVLPLKGPVLAERIYGEAQARVSADIDLLVDRSDTAAAIATLGRLGYRSPFETDIDRRRPEVHELLRSGSGLPELELHWRLHWYDERFGTEMLRRARTGEDGYLHPRPADELTALLLAYAREGFAGLRQLADITTWWDTFGHVLDSGELDEVAELDPGIVRPVATSAAIAQRLGGLPADRLLSQTLLCRASRAAARLSNWPLRGPHPQIGANVTLTDWFLALPGQRRALFGRHLWLSEEVLRLRRRDAGSSCPRLSRTRILHMRIVHLIRLCGRYAIALWPICRRSSWAPAPPWLDAAAVGRPAGRGDR